jgi:hypothetical protein
MSVPELSSLTKVDIALVTESAATNRSFLNDLPTEPGVPFPLDPTTPLTFQNQTNSHRAPNFKF